MAASLNDATDFIAWSWPQIEPYFLDLQSRHVDASSVDSFLADWSALAERLDETSRRLEVATTRNTADEEAGGRYHTFLDDIYPRAQESDQRLKEKLLASGLEPAGFEIPLRNMRAEAAIYRETNLPLLSQEKKLSEGYFKITGAQTVEWEGEEIPLSQLWPVLQSPDRSRRERAWRLSAERRLADHEALGEVWQELLDVRLRIAGNAGFPDYRSFRWQQLLRFDYSPAECVQFHQAVEEVVVPAAARILDRRRRKLRLDSLRPWDLSVDPLSRQPLRPFENIPELEEKSSSVFHRVDPQLGAHFDTMVQEDLLDLEPRKNKAPGGYCLPFNAVKRPFIFLSLTGTHDDLVGLLHEGGHAFHVLEMARLPYYHQRDIERIGPEFGEVGSTAMELLAMPYLSASEGGFYSEEDAARARLEYLEDLILSWRSTAQVDAFQHWIYENVDIASNPDACDAVFREFSERYISGVNWSGLERERGAHWRSILHIFEIPFYYLEYGLAQLGAVQIWANARRDQAGAVAQYRRALQLGDTRPIPELFAAAGARFAFDAQTLGEAVRLIEQAIDELEPAQV